MKAIQPKGNTVDGDPPSNISSLSPFGFPQLFSYRLIVKRFKLSDINN